MGKLVLHIPGGGMRDIPLDRDRITLGRRADNDVCLPYPAVSAEHAAIVTVLDDSFLEDLQSTNGTLVNGTRITKHFLRDRDAIDVGRVQLVYLADNNGVIAPLEPQVAATEASRMNQRPTIGYPAPSPHENRLDDKGAQGPEDRDLTSVDHLLAELMRASSNAAVAIDIPPPVAIVSDAHPGTVSERDRRSDGTSGAYLEVMNGPHAGQIVPMTKREFVLGHKGATRALIRRDEDRFMLIRVHLSTSISINGAPLANEQTQLAFGDSIDIAGVLLRFGRRPPL